MPLYLSYDDLQKIGTDGSLEERTLPGFSNCSNLVVAATNEAAIDGKLTLRIPGSQVTVERALQL